MNTKVLTLIPARRGSKGIKKKNLKKIGGIPLFFRAINTASQSKKTTKIAVSSNDNAIKTAVLKNKIDYIDRPDSLASDNSHINSTIEHALNFYKRKNIYFDIVVLLQPTSPFRTAAQLDQLVKNLENSQSDSIVSIVPMFEKNPARMYKIGKNEILNPIDKNQEHLRRQDLKPVYFRNGCFYAVKVSYFNRDKKLISDNKIGFIMDPKWLINIDEDIDLKLANLVYKDWENEHLNNRE